MMFPSVFSLSILVFLAVLSCMALLLLLLLNASLIMFNRCQNRKTEEHVDVSLYSFRKSNLFTFIFFFLIGNLFTFFTVKFLGSFILRPDVCNKE